MLSSLVSKVIMLLGVTELVKGSLLNYYYYYFNYYYYFYYYYYSSSDSNSSSSYNMILRFINPKNRGRPKAWGVNISLRIGL